MSSSGGNPIDDNDKADEKKKQGSTDWEDFRQFYKNYVSALAVLKDTLDVLWKLAPIGLVMPAMLIWAYLRKIGWLQLFPEAVVSVPGLVVMIVASCLLTLLLAIQFGIPSIISVSAVGAYEEQNKIAKAAGTSVRKPLAFLFVGAPLAWLLVFGVLSLVWNLSAGWCFSMGMVGMAVFEFAIVRWKWKVLSDPGKRGCLDNVIQFLKVTFAPTISAISVLPSLVVCLGIFSGENLSGWTAFGVFAGCVFYSVIGVLPGMVYLLEKLSDKKPFDIFKTTVFIGALVFYSVWMVALTLGPVTSTVLRSIGAIDETRYVYQVLKPDLVTGLQGAGFRVYTAGTSVYSKDQSYFVDGYVRFNFANVLLLCRDSLDFSKADGAAMSTADAQKRLLIWRAGGYFCVKAHTDDVRLLQSRIKR
ncbi:hypothetical protein PFF91_03610 [Burkholderia cenocepacia]|uniref:hypothetical protein n=1 Tax=Burkholderia cenocepacia TaxID=95486 RepID=UPI0022EA5D7D|nr:hypothetical protein [Burkholderia cenocepacia]MDA3668061.1 hypothetical protein [Burkholderia cenocepacia]MDA3675241.1 hypothetical protein [Burkholderia cenocepacia]MDA3683224.1 hypothetical protein [Burkholderia cenocepacia]MDA3690061.1 hypothetical protein [Burkholderia cenocepacia]MDA3697987.1 hypothetical protein [Burkholderia cenocepacia]